MKLTKGEKYDTSKLQFVCWTDGDKSNTEGYNYLDYFDQSGKYIGPDEFGIEPEFEKDAEKQADDFFATVPYKTRKLCTRSNRGPTMKCNRCNGTGFLNLHQIDGMDVPDSTDGVAILKWIHTHDGHDVQVCDCCGNGQDWYDVPGKHYNER